MKPVEEIREMSFEIGMIGRHGLDIDEPKSRLFPVNESFSICKQNVYSM